MDQQLLSKLSNPVNHVARAYEARTGQLEAERDRDAQKIAQQQQAEKKAMTEAQMKRDNAMLKVFEFAGDGRIEEAKYYADQNGLQVPEEIYGNSDFAKGLSTAGNFYGDDPAGAQKFTMAWMQTRDIGDYGQRVIRASQMAGIPVNPKDREFQRQLKLEEFKNTLKSGNARKDLFVDATTESLGSFTPDPDAGRKAVEGYDKFFGNETPVLYNPAISEGLVGDPVAASNSAIQERQQQIGVNPYQTPDRLQTNQPEIPAGLPSGTVMIGTSNGRPVYQAPNGERFIDDGNP